MKLHKRNIRVPLGRLAKPLSLSLQASADGIIQVANANMARALRVISLERGHDPRQFTLVAFGGAGGLHACELATSLEIPRVLIPNHPGILSAYGMAYADWVRDYVQTLLLTEDKATARRLDRELTGLKKKSRGDARLAGHSLGQIKYTCELDIRYVGQSYELRVPLSQNFKSVFSRSHKKQFGFSHRLPIEIVNIRLQARVEQKRRARPSRRSKMRRAKPKPIGHAKLYWKQKTWDIVYFDRTEIRPGNRIKGPAVITEFSATTFVPPGWKLDCDKNGNFILETTK